MYTHNRTALFPLNTVLFPGCTLPLQIFEQRYQRLVTTCLREEHGFTVVLISSGREVGDTPEIYSIGCYVEIVDWESLDNGLLGITIEAKHRVRVSSPSVQDDGLMTGDIDRLAMPEEADLSRNPITDLVDTLRQLESHPYIENHAPAIDYSSTRDVCYKLSQLLPVDNLTKQTLLEINNTEEEIDRLRHIINQLQA